MLIFSLSIKSIKKLPILKSKRYLGLTFFGTIVGALCLILFTTLVEDVFFKEINYCTSTPSELTFKTLALLGAGSVVGFKSSLLVMRSNFWPHIVLSAAVFVQLFIVKECPLTADPIWYDALQCSFLTGGLWLGNYSAHKFPLAPV